MLRNIENFIRHQAFPSARLTLFGSSCNGFGFRNSDLDICMTFEDCSEPQVGSLKDARGVRRLPGQVGLWAVILGRAVPLHYGSDAGFSTPKIITTINLRPDGGS